MTIDYVVRRIKEDDLVYGYLTFGEIDKILDAVSERENCRYAITDVMSAGSIAAAFPWMDKKYPVIREYINERKEAAK